MRKIHFPSFLSKLWWKRKQCNLPPQLATHGAEIGRSRQHAAAVVDRHPVIVRRTVRQSEQSAAEGQPHKQPVRSVDRLAPLFAVTVVYAGKVYRKERVLLRFRERAAHAHIAVGEQKAIPVVDGAFGIIPRFCQFPKVHRCSLKSRGTRSLRRETNGCRAVFTVSERQAPLQRAYRSSRRLQAASDRPRAG